MWRQAGNSCPLNCVTWCGRSCLGLGHLEGCGSFCGLCSFFSGCTSSPGPKEHRFPPALSSEKALSRENIFAPTCPPWWLHNDLRALQRKGFSRKTEFIFPYCLLSQCTALFQHRACGTHPSCLLPVQIVHYLYITHTCYLTYFSFFF